MQTPWCKSPCLRRANVSPETKVMIIGVGLIPGNYIWWLLKISEPVDNVRLSFAKDTGPDETVDQEVYIYSCSRTNVSTVTSMHRNA